MKRMTAHGSAAWAGSYWTAVSPTATNVLTHLVIFAKMSLTTIVSPFPTFGGDLNGTIGGLLSFNDIQDIVQVGAMFAKHSLSFAFNVGCSRASDQRSILGFYPRGNRHSLEIKFCGAGWFATQDSWASFDCDAAIITVRFTGHVSYSRNAPANQHCGKGIHNSVSQIRPNHII